MTNEFKAQYAYIKRNPEKYAAYANKYYHANKEKYALRTKLWREKNKEYILEQQRNKKRDRKLFAIEYLGGCCKICSNKFHPSVYEFHHRNPEEKDRDPSKMLQLSMEKLKTELDKCDLLCANCHRVAHHGDKY